MKYLKKILRNTEWDRERNENSRRQQATKIYRKQLNWCGQMNHDSIVEKVIDSGSMMKRSQGRPRKC